MVLWAGNIHCYPFPACGVLSDEACIINEVDLVWSVDSFSSHKLNLELKPSILEAQEHLRGGGGGGQNNGFWVKYTRVSVAKR